MPTKDQTRGDTDNLVIFITLYTFSVIIFNTLNMFSVYEVGSS